MIRRILTFFFFLIFPLFLFSIDISPEYASRVAHNFFLDKAPINYFDSKEPITLLQPKATYKNDVLVYYTVEFPDLGFVIVAADDQCYPILAYGYKALKESAEIPDACTARLDWYADQILEVKNKRPGSNESIQNSWNYYGLEEFNVFSKTKDEGIGPLTTSQWGQKYYYNGQCPVDPDGPGGHAIAGCVATALAQVLFYYRYPIQGEGSNGYMSDYGYEYVDFEDAEYKWDEMVNEISGAPCPEIAELTYHAGVAVDMDFGPSSSGALTIEAVDALRDYFKYSPNLNYISLFDLGYDFKDSLFENLDQNRVILYRGGDFGGGHAFVCDGYQDTSFFHFNWGWNGNYNGYYLLDNLNPNVYNFTYNQEAIINIYPSESYPEYCQGNTSLTKSRGTFTDGSGPENYQSNSSCSWLLSPEETGITNIQLWFTRFNAPEGDDKVLVYDGPSTVDPLLGQFWGEDLPPMLVSSGPQMLVVFESGENGIGEGWQAEYLAYSGPFCNGFTQMTGMSKTFFTDGSGSYNYIDNSDCGWLLKPQEEGVDSVGQVHLYFHWSTLAAGDTLFIYDGADNTASLMKKVYGDELPDTIHSSSNMLYMNFISDNVLNADGWAAGYTSSLPVYCEDTLYYTEKTGIIEDGSGEKIYVPNSYCHWLIETENTELITFEFLEFDLEYGYDQLKFYDASVDPPVLYGTYWGHDIPPILKMFTNKVLIRFTTDESAEYDGWKINYTALAPGILESKLERSVFLVPNPASTSVSIVGVEGNVEVEIFDSQQRLLLEHEFLTGINNDRKINVQPLQPGVYFVLLKTKAHRFIKKLVIQ